MNNKLLSLESLLDWFSSKKKHKWLQSTDFIFLELKNFLKRMIGRSKNILDLYKKDKGKVDFKTGIEPFKIWRKIKTCLKEWFIF